MEKRLVKQTLKVSVAVASALELCRFTLFHSVSAAVVVFSSLWIMSSSPRADSGPHEGSGVARLDRSISWPEVIKGD